MSHRPTEPRNESSFRMRQDEPLGSQMVLSAHELADAVGINVDRLQALIDFGLIESVDREGTEFAASTVPRLRRMMRLRADLGVSFLGASIIVELLERLDRLEGRR